jgi:hypothetical protein
MRMWPGRTQSRGRCGRGEPSFGADGCSDVADQRTELLGPQSKQTKGPIAAERGHELVLDVQRRGRRVSKDGACDLRKAEVVCEHHWSTPVSSCGGQQRVSGSPPATSAPGLGSPLPHLHRDWASAPGLGSSRATSAPGLGSPCHIRTGTGLAPATFASGLGSPLPHLHRDWARPCHIRIGTGLTLPQLHRDWAHPATSAPGLGSPLSQLHRDWAHPATSAPGLGSPGHIRTGTGLARPHPHRDWAHPCHISQGKSTCQQNQM